MDDGDALSRDAHISELDARLTGLDRLDPLWSMTAKELMWLLVLRWAEDRRRDDMDRVADLLRDLPVTEFEGSAWIPVLALATLLMRARWSVTDIRDDLDTAASIALHARTLGPPDPKSGSDLADNMTNVFATRFQTYGELPDLDIAISASRDRLRYESLGDRTPVINNLAALLNHRWLALGMDQDIAEAVEPETEVVSATPPGDERLPTRLANLAAHLDDLEFCQPHPDHVRRAAACGRQAVGLLPEDHPERVQILTAQAKRLGYSTTADDPVLDEVIALTSEVVALSGPLAEPTVHQIRATALKVRYQRRLARADLDEWIASARRAAFTWPSEQKGQELPLAILAEGQLELWMLDGDREDLDLAVTVYDQAVAVYDRSAAINHDLLPATLGSTARARLRRYEGFGSGDDLDGAIDRFERAVALLSPGTEQRTYQCRGLIDALGERQMREADSPDLDRRIELLHECDATLGPQHPDAAALAFLYAVTMCARYDRRGGADDITRAVEAADRATRLTAPKAPELAQRLAYASDVHVKRWRLTRDLDDLDLAAEHARMAAKLASEPEFRDQAKQAVREIVGLRDAALDTYTHRDHWRRNKRRRNPTTPASIAAERIEELTDGGPLPPGGVVELLGTIPVFDDLDELHNSAIGWRVVRISGLRPADPPDESSVWDQTGINRHRYASDGPLIARVRNHLRTSAEGSPTS